MATLRTIERALARARCGAAACVTSRSRARFAYPLSPRERKGRENLSRAMRFGSRGRPRVRVHEAYLACVFFFNTHWGPARRVVYSVLSSRESVWGLCYCPHRSVTTCEIHNRWGAAGLCAGPRDHNTRRRARPAFYFERLKTQNG